MEVAVVKYNAGNVFSVINALSRLGVKAVLTDDAEVIQNASHVVFPGQGEAAGAMKCLRDTGLDKVILGLRQPVLGICIGQQLMCRHSEEGDVDCLGIFDIDVKRFVVNPDDNRWKIPHMGWNTVTDLGGLMDLGHSEEWMYFIHSYYVPLSEWTVGATSYCDIKFSAAMQKDNFMSAQFHPEKSGDAGYRLLQHFLKL